MDPRALGIIARLRAAWDDEAGPSIRRALLALFAAIFFGSLHLARVGSFAARAATASILVAALVALVARWLVRRRRAADARAVIRGTIGRTDPELGAAALRAMTLVERSTSEPDAGSPELAALHLQRTLGRASIEGITERAAASGARWSAVGLVAATAAAFVVGVEPFRVFEGLDVLAARDGEAPLPVVWLDEVEIDAKPPEYLHLPQVALFSFEPAMLPRGSQITVRGRATHDGRRLVLTDGAREEPFVDDGSGQLVAHMVLEDTARYFVAARFGDVRIHQPDEQIITSIPDLAPVVVVEGAPRTVRLLDEPSVSFRYEASDDHGLREVNLVLRTGTREERRVLSRPNADAKVDRGGYELRAADPFFKRTYAPVEVTVEARDADPVTGPKWGKSPAVLVVPPQVGEPEALRYEAIERARDALTDLLATRLAPFAGQTAAEKASHAQAEADAQRLVEARIDEALQGTYGGLRIRGRAASLARGQLRRLAEALAAEKKSTTALSHQRLVDETEGVLLAIDAAMASLGTLDARAVAKRLADVADDAAEGAAIAVAVGDRARGQARLDAATGVLDGGGKQLLRLGDLGLDLGEIVANDLRRIDRTQKKGDFVHAELAARDLAARLRRPDPSFSGGGGGVESGGGGAPQPGEASPADKEAAQLERELSELVREHAREIGEVGDALDRASSPEELDQLKQEAKERAEALREAVKGLPRSGGAPGSAEAAGAAARERAEAMAAALEGGRPADAIESGKGAMDALGEAQRVGAQNDASRAEARAARESTKARPEVEAQLAWAEEVVEKLRRSASERAKDALDESGGDEGKLADRARELGRKGESGDSAVPEHVLDHLRDAEQAMREAAKALREGKGDQGLERQKDAQRLLEMAQGERSRDGDGQQEPAGDDEPAEGKTDIPGKDEHKGPEAFRKRVLEGLGGSVDPMLREAVKRYAEGLLR